MALHEVRGTQEEQCWGMGDLFWVGMRQVMAAVARVLGPSVAELATERAGSREC